MLSFLGKLFSSDEAIKSTAGALRDGLDALVYTDEEKAKDAAASLTEARSMLIKWMDSTQGQNLARRFLAVALSMLWGPFTACRLHCHLSLHGFRLTQAKSSWSQLTYWVNQRASLTGL